MTTFTDPAAIIGRNAVDRDGDKIGKIGQVYLDDDSGQPLWIAISTGLFGTKDSFAPLSGASDDGTDLRLAVEKDRVKDAPNVENDGHLNEREQRALYDYYSDYVGNGHTGTITGDVTDGTDLTAGGNDGAVGGPGQDVSGPNTDSAMTRSEEQVDVGTERVQAGRARLRKYVVTENVTQTVPVSHEEVRLEREPITDANIGAATDGPDISEEEHEVTLSAERPVVAKEAVPVERVRLGTETVTEQQAVNEQVRKEQIDLDDETGTARES
jgi:uncharacterized protein (TIGR02271 family)